MVLTKETTYQRLKRENLELKQKLALLVSDPNSMEALCVRQEVAVSVDIERAIWQGNLCNNQNEGLVNVIATWQKQ